MNLVGYVSNNKVVHYVSNGIFYSESQRNKKSPPELYFILYITFYYEGRI